MKQFEHRVDESVRRQHAIMVANSAGVEGWELVAVVESTTSAHEVDLFFKREKAQSMPTSEQVRFVVGKTHVNPQIARDALLMSDCNVSQAILRLSN